MSHRVVYSQKELETAIREGINEITLSAGAFDIPKTGNTYFDRIGPVSVTVGCTRAEADKTGMRFSGIYPDYKPGYAIDGRASMAVVAAVSSGSYGSFASSGSGSGIFGSGSYGSGMKYYEYEFEYVSSTSNAGSFSTSFRLSGSRSGFAAAAEEDTRRVVRVYGYGINLI